MRHGQLPRPASQPFPRSGNAYVAGQPGQPQRLHQRKLRQGNPRALLYGRGQLHRRRHQGMRPRLYRLERSQPRLYVHQDAEQHRAALRLHRLAIQLRRRRPRPRRQALSRRNRRFQRRGRRGHHLQARGNSPLYRPPPLPLLRRRRIPRPAMALRRPARSRRH